ncbi:MAG: hypothetical protein HC818_00815 [Synechococcaceae cyanobacterium RM1_1_27]|nr:hypothetical protein [Synechococcaceae cyanobacterium SM2_3_2]NJO85416.1 hypothetical protein [Synechococcaceae cyanobacterium RM1_1_27]
MASSLHSLSSVYQDSNPSNYPQRQSFEVPPTKKWQIWQQLRQLAVPVWVDPSGRLNVVVSSALMAERVSTLIPH